METLIDRYFKLKEDIARAEPQFSIKILNNMSKEAFNYGQNGDISERQGVITDLEILIKLFSQSGVYCSPCACSGQVFYSADYLPPCPCCDTDFLNKDADLLEQLANTKCKELDDICEQYGLDVPQ